MLSGFRKILFWCHLAVGLVAGVVVLIMSLTGVLLTYQKQMQLWADTRGYYSPPPSPDAVPLSPEALLARVKAANPDITINSLTVRSAEGAPAEIGVGSGPGAQPLFVNRYDGQLLGAGATGLRAFFRTVTDFHRWLGATADYRNMGRAVTGACNLGFLFLVSSGFYLWWPRNATWRQVRQVLWFRTGLRGRARNFNWHNVIGVWSWVPLFVVVASASVISYPWASNLVYRIAGENPPASPAPPSTPAPNRGAASSAGGPAARSARTGGERRESRPATPLEAGRLDTLWAKAENQVEGWKAISVRVPAGQAPSLTFTIDEGYAGQPQKRGQLTLDASTAAIVRWEDFSSLTPGRRLRSLLRFAHTGEVGGLFGQTIAGIASAGGVVLVWTGISLALRRFAAWISALRARQRSKATYPKPTAIATLADERAEG